MARLAVWTLCIFALIAFHAEGHAQSNRQVKILQNLGGGVYVVELPNGKVVEAQLKDNDQRRGARMSRGTRKRVQSRLNALGFNAGKVDGKFGRGTRTAIKTWQSSKGLQATGYLKRQHLKVLFSVGQNPQNDQSTPAPNASPKHKFALMFSTDLPGFDYRNPNNDSSLLNTGRDGCIDACAADTNCKAFTYNEEARWCWLKSGIGSEKPFARAVSGVKRIERAVSYKDPGGHEEAQREIWRQIEAGTYWKKSEQAEQPPQASKKLEGTGAKLPKSADAPIVLKPSSAPEQRGLAKVESGVTQQANAPAPAPKIAKAHPSENELKDVKFPNFKPHTISSVRASLAAAAGECIVLAPDPRFIHQVLKIDPTENYSDRVALIIGNGAYQANINQLKNPINDAAAVSTTLSSMGFKVFVVADGTANDISACSDKAINAMTNTAVGLLYYSGHGIQIKDQNYLVAVDASVKDGAQRGFVATQPIVEKLRTNSAAALVFLDACRDNPLSDGKQGLAVSTGRSVGRGLQRVESGNQNQLEAETKVTRGLFVAYATSPNNVASDGSGELSPFSAAFVKHISETGNSLQKVMSQVNNSVGESTNWAQSPWIRSSLTTQLKLNGEQSLEEAKLVSDNWARESKLLLAKGMRQEAIVAALKGLPARPDKETIKDFSAAHLALYMSEKSNVAMLPIRITGKSSISADGTRVALVHRPPNGRSELQLWDAVSRSKIKTLRLLEDGEALYHMRFSPDSKVVIVAAQASGRFTDVWSATDGKLLSKLQTSQKAVGTYAIRFKFSYNSKYLVTSKDGLNNKLDIWDLSEGIIAHTFDETKLGKLTSTSNRSKYYNLNGALDYAGKPLAFSTYTGNGKTIMIGIYNFERGVLERFDKAGDAIAGDDDIALSPDGEMLALMYHSKGTQSFVVFTLSDGKKVLNVPAIGGHISFDFNPAQHSSQLTISSPVLGRSMIDAKTGGTIIKLSELDGFEPDYPKIYDTNGLRVDGEPTISYDAFWRRVPDDERLVQYSIGRLLDRFRREVSNNRIKFWKP